MIREEIRNIFTLFSTNLILKDATEEEKREVRIKQNEDIYRKLYVAAAVFIFVQLFFITSDLVTGFYGRIESSYLNLTAEVLITTASVLTVMGLLLLKNNKGSEKVRWLQLGYYLVLETGFLFYLLSDMLRNLTNINNTFYNMVILAIFAVYSFKKVVILTAYISVGTAIFLLVLPNRFPWETYQMLPLFLLLFFLCANFFRAENTKRFYTQVKIQALAREMEELSTRDFLTKLPNRTALNLFLQNELKLAAQRKQMVGLMMMDIDDFKAFNDFHSHLKGDLCLHQVGQALLRLQNEKFHVFRYGGEEFLVIGVDISDQELTEFAASIHRELNGMGIPRGDSINEEGYITASIGCSLANLSGMDGYNDLLRAADRALYRAKRRGNNCYVYKNVKYTV